MRGRRIKREGIGEEGCRRTGTDEKGRKVRGRRIKKERIGEKGYRNNNYSIRQEGIK